MVGYQRSVGKVTLAGWPSLAPSQSLPDRAHPPCKSDKETWLDADSQPDSHIYLAAYVVSRIHVLCSTRTDSQTGKTKIA